MTQQSRVVVVSGASKGIGKAIALKAGREGSFVVVNYRSDKSRAENVVSEIGCHRAIAVQADMAIHAEVARLVEAAVARFGKIDVLIANAAAAFSTEFESATEADFDAAFGLNVKGPLFLAQVRSLLIIWHNEYRLITNQCFRRLSPLWQTEVG